jgi:hypothetical protein
VTDIHQLAFDHLENLLCAASVLAYPDFKTRFYLATDASVLALEQSFTNYQMVTLVLLRIHHMHSVILNLTGKFPRMYFMH